MDTTSLITGGKEDVSQLLHVCNRREVHVIHLRDLGLRVLLFCI
jgi:hypothetical protein